MSNEFSMQLYMNFNLLLSIHCVMRMRIMYWKFDEVYMALVVVREDASEAQSAKKAFEYEFSLILNLI